MTQQRFEYVLTLDANVAGRLLVNVVLVCTGREGGMDSEYSGWGGMRNDGAEIFKVVA